ncbi:MAG: SGNH/GDSL hydrolase family protein [Kiritimatiellia bacterium]
MSQQNIEKLDPNLASTGAADGLRWHDIRRLELEGQGWEVTAHPFDRFPARAEALVSAPVWALSHCSAGLAVRFATEATTFSARWTLRSDSLALAHMPATGASGLDLYHREGADWRWVATGVARAKANSQELLVGLEPGILREFRLYLPLYNGVESVEIGVPESESIVKLPPRPGKPICFYGSSITQGGCASRPGSCYTAVAARRLDRSHYNFGFSGNARMEPAVAELLTELEPCAYVLDAFPNMYPDLIRERLVPFIRILRRARPSTPIVLMENVQYLNYPLNKIHRLDYAEKNKAAREGCAVLQDEGVTRLTRVPGWHLPGADREGTVDGVHPTDLGFARMAEVLIPFLQPLV